MRGFSGFGLPTNAHNNRRREDRIVALRASMPYQSVIPGPVVQALHHRPMTGALNPSVHLGQLGCPCEGTPLDQLDRMGNPMGAASDQPEDLTAALEQLLPAAASIVQGLMTADPRRNTHVYAARLENLKRMRDTSPPLVARVLDNRINLLEARLAAARESLEIQRASERSTRVWRVLGYSATASGIAAAVGLTALTIDGVRYLGRR